MRTYLDFEKPLAEIREQIERLRSNLDPLAEQNDKELAKLVKKSQQLERDIFRKLTPWQKTQLARHPDRPSMLEYLERFVDGFVELHGDRVYADDPAIVGGIGRVGGREVVLIGHQKGRTLKTRMIRNFGMPHPEGYRKTQRLMHFAERFSKPVVCFIDTPGAYPGLGAEERGQSEAIARNLLIMSRLRVPVVVVVIGEGGSGGALALGVGDRIVMLEHTVYSVISPEGCAAILWNDAKKAQAAAEALKLTPPDLLKLGVIDEILPEPPGGAHNDPDYMAAAIRDTVIRHLNALEKEAVETLIDKRYQKFRAMGQFLEK